MSPQEGDGGAGSQCLIKLLALGPEFAACASVRLMLAIAVVESLKNF